MTHQSMGTAQTQTMDHQRTQIITQIQELVLILDRTVPITVQTMVQELRTFQLILSNPF